MAPWGAHVRREDGFAMALALYGTVLLVERKLLAWQQ